MQNLRRHQVALLRIEVGAKGLDDLPQRRRRGAPELRADRGVLVDMIIDHALDADPGVGVAGREYWLQELLFELVVNLEGEPELRERPGERPRITVGMGIELIREVLAVIHQLAKSVVLRDKLREGVTGGDLHRSENSKARAHARPDETRRSCAAIAEQRPSLRAVLRT